MVTAYLIMYLAQYKSLNKKQFCEMNEVNEQKLFFVMIYDVLNTLFKWAVTNVIYTTISIALGAQCYTNNNIILIVIYSITISNTIVSV